MNATFSYDPDGNLNAKTVGSAQRSYDWDVPGRLLSASNSSGVQGYYAYDGLGRRVEAKEGSSITFYSYQSTESLSDQFTSGSSNDYIYAAGLRIARTGYAASQYYYHTDALGSTRLVTDASGKIVFSDNYQPFGLDNGTPTGSETYRFTGKPVSQTTDLNCHFSCWQNLYSPRR